jgi:spermidine/putrescine transport system ATP-binding protein/putrescine transport system ATP-binding protein
MNKNLLSITNISKHFGDTVALNDVSIDIRENEFFALLGPSGCGKTTLLRVLAGFESPDTGSVTLGSQDLLGLAPNKRPINLMFQSYALFPHMSVEKNVAYGLQREGLGKEEIRDRVTEVLSTVGLTDKASRRPAQLSGGQRQRVALARAIVKRPQLLLLDEPLSALDRKVRAEMQLELKRLQHEVGITFVVVTHDQDEAMSMADRIAVMSEGVVQQVASPVDLYSRPENLFVADFIGTSNAFRGVATETGLLVEDLGLLPGSVGASSGEATLIIRPEDVRLVDQAHALLTGSVIDTQFTGGSSTIALSVLGQPAPVLVSCQGSADVSRGDTVHLAWDASRAIKLTK